MPYWGNEWSPSGAVFDLEGLKKERAAVEEALSLEETWSSPEKIHALRKKKASIEALLTPFSDVLGKFQYLQSSADVLEEEEGELFLPEIKEDIRELGGAIEELELRYLLGGELDRGDALLTIHPGAGGTESQDWAEMLMRMYLRWAELNGYRAAILDLLPGEEAGIKSVTIAVKGPYAYGRLKTEKGIHRLVRISPFDASKRRHTSFSAVLVYPEIEDNIEVELKPDDIRVDTFRASGAGGQHVNKTSSAVRITHLPTGIVVSCQNERSQHRNKEVALKILRARLYDLNLKEQERKLDSAVGDKKGIAWGNQIRSYVLQPYRLVKDHRTGIETSNVEAVLDGDLDIFIKEALKAGAVASGHGPRRH